MDNHAHHLRHSTNKATKTNRTLELEIEHQDQQHRQSHKWPLLPGEDNDAAGRTDDDDDDLGNTKHHSWNCRMVGIWVLNSSKYVLLLVNIAAWYWTNGMNGIVMQAFSSAFLSTSFLPNDVVGVVSSSSSFSMYSFIFHLQQFASIAYTTSAVTACQLLIGAVVGRLLLLGLGIMMNNNTNKQQQQKGNNNNSSTSSSTNRRITNGDIAATHSYPLSGLHAMGSLATNLGFAYGKASLVQLIKLLEPFETLILTQLLVVSSTTTSSLVETKLCRSGILSSMAVVVGSAMSLVQLQSTPPHPLAIIFAILSGLCLSCRNVLQRNQHVLFKTNNTNDSEGSSTVSPQATSKEQQEQEKRSWSKLETSIVQFTQLSFFSGLWMIGMTFCFHMLGLLLQFMTKMESKAFFFPFLHSTTMISTFTILGLYTWHPLYNICSMITLGFCTAVTHSLLNAGKRVVAISMAMVWFREESSTNPATLAGLVGVAVGGLWYTNESKQKSTTNITNSIGSNPSNIYSRPSYDDRKNFGIAVIALTSLIFFQHLFDTSKNK